MKAFVCLTTDDRQWLAEMLTAWLEDQDLMLSHMQEDPSLGWNNLLGAAADVSDQRRHIERICGALGRSLASMPDPALLQHTQVVYSRMMEQSRKMREGGVDLVVYEGPLTHLIINDIGLPNPYYTSITQALIGMGCARQLKRGGGGQPSQWELIRDPSAELWTTYMESKGESEPEVEVATAQSVRDLTSRIDRLEKALGVAP
jgi:hypothetical protein